MSQTEETKPAQDMRQSASSKLLGFLPWVCPEHPKAMVVHEWYQTYTIGWSDGYPRSGGTHSHKWFCEICERELAPEE